MNPDFINAALGGLLIGLSSILLLAALGKIAGISGIFWRSLSSVTKGLNTDSLWQWFFLAGLLIGPIIVHHLFGHPIPAPSDAGVILAGVAGILVGFGSNLGSGCTSGHGICGIGRLSKRSISATLTFMSAGIITVYLSKFTF